MKLSFKYQFIISFVTLGAFFVMMIAYINFQAIETTTQRLIDQKIEYLKTTSSKLLGKPLSIYDIATIDDIVGGLSTLKSIKGIKVVDKQDKVISQSGYSKIDNTFLQIRHSITQDNITLGSIVFCLDFSKHYQYIEKNRIQTIQIIFIEILLSILFSYIIGYRISRDLEELTTVAQKIGNDVDIDLPSKQSSNEISKLSYAMKEMQIEIKDRSCRLLEQQNMVDKYVIISATDLEGNITYASEAFCQISGFTKAELIGENHRIVRHLDMPKELYKDLWQTITQEKSWEGEIKNCRKDGKFYWINAHIDPIYNRFDKHIGYRAIREDITDKKRVEELSITDRLTKLYNRLKIDEVFAYEIEQAKRYHTPLAIIMLDLDKFKSVNDIFGHQVGDEVLQALASILQSQSRSVDLVGRWGGEEFIIIAPNIQLKGALVLAQKLRKSIEEHRFNQVGQKTASFGVSEYIDEDTQESMIARADKALFMAKNAGRNQVVVSIDNSNYQTSEEF